MTKPLVFKLSLLFDEPVTDKVGNWTYAAADAVEVLTGRKAQLIAAKRENKFKDWSFPVSMLTATVLFAPQGAGVPANLTLQGVHDLATNNETGSVASASSEFAEYIHGEFAFDAVQGILTVLPGHCCR